MDRSGVALPHSFASFSFTLLKKAHSYAFVLEAVKIEKPFVVVKSTLVTGQDLIPPTLGNNKTTILRLYDWVYLSG